MAVGVSWAQCQEVCKNKDAALSHMRSQLQELKKLETFKDGISSAQTQNLYLFFMVSEFRGTGSFLSLDDPYLSCKSFSFPTVFITVYIEVLFF